MVASAAIRGDAADAEYSLLGMMEAACRAVDPDGVRWCVNPGAGSAPWVRVDRINAAVPSQGWKLHLSATVASAPEVLRRALAVLLTDDAAFKVAASIGALHGLNEGRGGVSQVGKFIAVYPRDDAQAVHLAGLLHHATVGLHGPAIASDRRLRPDSAVYYRYGGFTGELIQTPLGEVLPAIRDAQGVLVPDRRGVTYSAPEGIADPFVAAGFVRPAITPRLLIAERYLPLATLFRSPRGSVSLAVETETGERRVLKRARRDAMTTIDGSDARDRLRHEAAVLRALHPDPRFPTVHDLVEHNGDAVLVMDEIAGETLQQAVQREMAVGRLPDGEQVVTWGRQVAAALAAIHARGWVYCDLKPANTIARPDRTLAFVDFELACRIGGDGEWRAGAGTRGYLSPQQDAGEPPAVADDVYSLGALLFYAATGAEPAHAPAPFALTERRVGLLNPAIGGALETIIDRCLDPDPARRYRSAAAVDAALAGGEAVSLALPSLGSERIDGTEAVNRRRWAELARRTGDALCDAARPCSEMDGVMWLSTHANVEGLPYRDVGTGGAGALLALAEVSGRFGDARHRDTLRSGARWLAMSRPIADPPLPGLYVGEAGVGAALLRAGQVLADRRIVAAAAERGRLVASLPYASPDLYHGTAGRVRFHLLLWDETGEHEHLAAATDAGANLLAGAQDAGDGGVRWTIPPGYDGLSGAAYLGYAHGAAGIGDALLDLFEATGDTRFSSAAAGAARWLSRQAIPALPDGDGLAWPAVEGATPWAPMWCHGATGIGRFFLQAARLECIPDALAIAVAAARSAARGARWTGTTQCHGLAGQIEFLLDVAQQCGEAAYRAEAAALARLLEAFATERPGGIVFPSEAPSTFTPDYMVGYAGVAACLVRLCDPDTAPSQLSRAGFRRRYG